MTPSVARGVDFKAAFRQFGGHDPYPWQVRLYERFMAGDIPDVLDIPTGLGKTSIIPIWLIALASARDQGAGMHVPRRLVYIVDRRVIVDQATNDARRISDTLGTNAVALGRLDRFHMSTFRGGGGTADGREWMRHPDEPALLIGTVDMIGSRLFFSGYGLGRSVRPFYAGLLGWDSLIVLDEAHLSPALERTLFDMKKMAMGQLALPFPPKIMVMSATGRPGSSPRRTLGLDGDDFRHSRVRKRYEAKKILSLEDAGEKDVASTITELALAMSGRTLVYVQAPAAAASIAAKLRAEGKPTGVLTGTMRGFERDLLTRRAPHSGRSGDDSQDAARGDPPPHGSGDKGGGNGVASDVFAAFDSDGGIAGMADCYLVATSAGEVGVDIDADNMVCDLTTFDSLVQRLGRVNRSGGRVAQVTVVYSDAAIRRSKSLSGQLEKTLALLKNLTGGKKYNASPQALSEIAGEQKDGALAPAPLTQPLARDVVGMWSMTSLYEPYPPRPAVHHWLRGHEESGIPDTYVAWRRDVDDLASADPATIGDVLDRYAILPHETARGTTSSMKKTLEKISQKKRGRRAILRKPDSTIHVKKIEEIDDADLRYSVLLLPCSAGGLDESGLLAGATASVPDVADDPRYADRRRIEVHVWADGRAAVVGDGDEQDLAEWLGANPRMKLVSSVVKRAGEDDSDPPAVELRYYAAKPDMPYSASSVPQRVIDHNNAVRETAVRIAGALGLSAGIADAVIEAAARHDLGKAHAHWQACMHGDPQEPLAKTASRRRPLNLGGFRHEFESMKMSYDDLGDHPERDLVLHLIAAHHGWARPCFRPNAAPGAAECDHLDVARRYAALERRFGPWGLAWLEGLVRGADWQASERQEGGRG